MPKRPKVWFGTLNDIAGLTRPWLTSANSTGFNYSATTLRGDGFAKRSALTHRGSSRSLGGQHRGRARALPYQLSTNELLYVDPLGEDEPPAWFHVTLHSERHGVHGRHPHVATRGPTTRSAWSGTRRGYGRSGRSTGRRLAVGGCRGRDDPDKRTAVTAVMSSMTLRRRRSLRNTSNPWGEVQMWASSRISSICVRAYPRRR